MGLHKVMSPVPGSVEKPKRKGKVWARVAEELGQGHKVRNPGLEALDPRVLRASKQTGTPYSKRGFHNIFGVEYGIVNLKDMNIFEDGSSVGPEELKQAGLVRRDRGM